jgi:FlaA1/EpsC-like NDP-sugar epimerase
VRFRLTLLLWLLSDLALFVGSYALAYFLRIGWIFSSVFPFGPYIAVAVIVAPLWLLTLISTRTFTLTRPQASTENAIGLVSACVVGVALFALTYFFLFDLFFSRLLLIIAFALSILLTALWHLIFERIARGILWKNPPAFPTLIVGVTRESMRLIELLAKTKNPLCPVAILDAQGTKEKEIHGIPVLGKLDKLEETLVGLRITHLIQCSDLEQSLNLLSACRTRKITYLLFPSVLGIVGRDERIESLEGRAVVMVRPEKGRYALTQ